MYSRSGRSLLFPSLLFLSHLESKFRALHRIKNFSQALAPNPNPNSNMNQCHLIYGMGQTEFRESNSFPRLRRIGIKGDSTANLSSLCRVPSSRWKRDRDTNRNDPWRSFGWWHQLMLCQLPQIVEELRIVAPAVGGLGVPQFGKTCLKLHSLLIFPPYLCVCVCV